MAASTADVAYMRVLVESGADPLASNVDHCTPLHAGAGIGTFAPGETAGTEPVVIEAVKLAIQLGGDVNAVDDNGETPMHGAAYKSFPKVVQLLSDNGAKVDVWNQKNKHGWTPLLISQGYRPGNFRPAPATIAAIERLSDTHLVRDVALTQTGMDIAVDPAVWREYGMLSAAQFARTLERLARKVDLTRYPKSKRGPKKPRPKRRSGRTNHHISAAKLLAKTKRKKKPRL